MGHNTSHYDDDPPDPKLLGGMHAASAAQAKSLLPGIRQKAAREEAGYKALREEGAGFRQSTRDIQAQGRMTSGDMSRSLIGANAGRHPWAASQAGMDAGQQRVRAAIAAAGPRQQGLEADTRYATAQASRLTEGQQTAESMANWRPHYESRRGMVRDGTFSHGGMHSYVMRELMPLADTPDDLLRLQALADFWGYRAANYSADEAREMSQAVRYPELAGMLE